MATSTKHHLIAARVTETEKLAFSQAARRQGRTESSLLLQLVREATAAAAAHPAEQPPDACREVSSDRITLRLLPGDRALAAERAAARSLPLSTYLVSLVRAHVRGCVPMTGDMLAVLKGLVAELGAVRRTLGLATATRLELATAIERACEIASRGSEEVRALLRERLREWSAGDA